MNKFISEMQLDFKDVLIQPRKSHLSSRSEVNLVQHYKFKHSKQTYTGVPVIVANMDTTGTMNMAKEMAKHQTMCALHKHYSLKDLQNFFSSIDSSNQVDVDLIAQNKHHLQHTFYSMGIVASDLKKFEEIVAKVGIFDESKPHLGGVRAVCIDVANGYMEALVKFCQELRKTHTNLIIMAGNVVDSQMTHELLERGMVDIVKVGIGSGSVCQTRVVAGVGRPQFSAILECQSVADNLGGYIVSDGGVTCIADFSKAFAVGCFGVMSGGMFSGHSECEQEVVEKDGQQFIAFYGMSSTQAMNKYSNGVANYRASEGKLVHIPFKGSVNQTIEGILGGVRSAHTYVGAKNMKEFAQKAHFYRVSQEVNEIYGRSK